MKEIELEITDLHGLISYQNWSSFEEKLCVKEKRLVMGAPALTTYSEFYL